MAHDEEPGKKLRRNLSLTSLENLPGESDAMIARHITLSCHDMDLNKIYHTFEIIRMDQTLKGG